MLCGQDTETLLVELLLSHYLEDAYSANSYAVNVYIVPGPQAIRLTRFSREDLENNRGPRVECCFRRVPRKTKATEKGRKGSSKKVSHEVAGSDSEVSTGFSNGRNTNLSRKRKRQPTADAGDKSDDLIVTDGNGLGDDDIDDFSHELQPVDAHESEPECNDWMFSM